MSTPIGHSAEQALQDRHKSSASATSADRQPAASDPLASSCSTLARPLVESFSSLVARKDGHITPEPAAVLIWRASRTTLVWRASGTTRHLPTPTQRWAAVLNCPSSSR